MYFPGLKEKRFGAFVLAFSAIVLALFIAHDIRTGSAGPDHVQGINDAAVVTGVETPANVVASAASSASKTKVAYGTAKYPSLTKVDYGTYRKLDYQQKSGQYTYFYDFRDTWYAAGTYLPGEKYDTHIANNFQGFWGIRASIDKDILTYEAYTYLDNVDVAGVEFRTYDDAETIILDATANEPHTRKTTSLKNGPYTLCVWFDYEHEDGEVETIGVWQPVYVSDGSGWFADWIRKADDKTFETWLTGKHDELAADDALQAWMVKNGGANAAKPIDVSGIYYPFKSGTSRYPNDTAKWAGLAHEICPDDDASDYVKAYRLFVWMQSNLAYDRDTTRADNPYRWASAAASGSAKGFTLWDSRLGECEDFANVYAIMCSELGIPCHVMSNSTHGWNVVYLNGRWELVDVNQGIRNAYVGTDNKTYAANVEAYWAKQKTGDDYDAILTGFCATAYGTFKIGSYEADKYEGVEDKINKTLSPLDECLYNSAYFNLWRGTIYGH